MEDKRPYKPRKPGAGRKPLKPNYDAAAILQEQIIRIRRNTLISPNCPIKLPIIETEDLLCIEK